jgi:hypothetical protein
MDLAELHAIVVTGDDLAADIDNLARSPGQIPQPVAVTYEEAPDIWRASQARAGAVCKKRRKRRW